jgi:nitrate/nitrite-specific signal transduction histidine kinase
MLNEDKTITHVAVAHTDPEKVAWARELQLRYPPDLAAPSGVPQVLRTGRSEIYPHITDEMIRAVARDDEQLRIIRDLQMRSAMVVPLKVEGRVLAAMTFVWAESGRHYTLADLELAEELARRAALAIDNARLYHIEQRNRQTAEWLSRRLSGLQAITAALSKAATPHQVAEAVMQQGLAQVGADSGLITLLDEAHENLALFHQVGYRPEEVAGWQSFPVAMAVPLADSVRTGEPLFIESNQILQERFPIFARQRKTPYQGLVTLPLRVTGQKIIGAIGLSFYQTRNFSTEEREFMLAIARQCAQALERARLYEAEQQARAEIEAAQQSLATLAETRERNRLAQELHDNIAQAIGYLYLQIAMADMQLEQGQLEALKESLQELKRVIWETYTDVRGEIFNLRSETTQDLNFLNTLQYYIEKYKRFYKLTISMELEAEAANFEFEPKVKSQIIRTIQEALMNVRKHAGVDEAVIRLSKRNEALYIQIEDQGQGFDTHASGVKEGSYGLQIMRERVQSIGGELIIASAPGQGTRITLVYPQ